MNTILQINTSLFGGERAVVPAGRRGCRPVGGLHRPQAPRAGPRAESRAPPDGRARHGVRHAGVGADARAAALRGESDALIDELRHADVLVLGLPMYNFGVSSVLKAYFDHVARAGVTFRYTAEGPVGLLTGKQAFVFATRGGRYAGTAGDLQSAYVRQFLASSGSATSSSSMPRAWRSASSSASRRLRPLRIASASCGVTQPAPDQFADLTSPQPETHP